MYRVSYLNDASGNVQLSEMMTKLDALNFAMTLTFDQEPRLVPVKPLQGPRGQLRNGDSCVRSQFSRFERNGRSGWEWVAFDDSARVVALVEYPDVLDGCFDTAYGSLWALRECAAGHFHTVRSHRGH